MLPFFSPPLADRPPASGPSLAETIARVRACSLRLTSGRRAMLDILLRAPVPITLAQLQAAIRPQRVALATLFRSMLRMEEMGLVNRSIDLRGTTNWELNHGRPRSFPLMQRDSGTTTRIDEDLAAPLRELLARVEDQLRLRGYRDLQLNVAFRSAPRTSPAPAQPAAPRRYVA